MRSITIPLKLPMSKQNIKEYDVVPANDIKQQLDTINLKGDIRLNEIRGSGIDLYTWSKYPCAKERKCADDKFCFDYISIKTNSIKEWKLIPPNLTVLAVRKRKKTYIVIDKTFRDFVDKKIFVINKMESISLNVGPASA
jgi:hypothetical protein